MARRAARTDDNQAAIVDALRRAGASVECLHMVGKGVPDLAVGFRGRNFFFEVKDGSKSPSRRKLTDDEQEWHVKWRGTVYIVESPEQALMIIGV